MMAELGAALRDELRRLLEPFTTAHTDDRVTMLLDLVGQGAAAGGQPGLRAAFEDVSALVDAVNAIDDFESWSGLQKLLQAGSAATRAVRALEASTSDPQRFSGLGVELIEQLLGMHLRRYHPRAFWFACLLMLIDPSELSAPQPAVFDGTAQTRAAWLRDEFHLERLSPLVDDPWATLSGTYFPNRLATALDARTSALRLFPLLGSVVEALGLAWTLDDKSLQPPSVVDPSTPPDFGDHGDATSTDDPSMGPTADPAAFYSNLQPRLSIVVPTLDGTRLVGTRLKVVVLASAADQPGGIAGLVFTLTGALTWSETRGHWQFALSSDGEIPVFVVGPSGIVPAPSGTPLRAATASLTVTRLPAADGQPVFLLGSARGTRLELGAARAQLQLAVAGTSSSASLTLQASSGKFVLVPGDDDFLAFVLPSGGVTVPFDAGLVLSSARGLELTGGAGLQAALPAHVAIGSLGSVDAVRLGVSATDGGLHADAVCDATVHLGLVDVSVDGVGMRCSVAVTNGGNLGVADLDVAFEAPSGLGLTVDGGPVTGSGALVFDPDRALYAGEMQLRFEEIAVRAVGLLTTGPSGYSLLVLVSAEFPPVQLGLGFMLVGVGGLLGINRTVAVEALRAGLKAGALGAVLSPPDPKANPAQLVASLAGLFPPAAGRYVFAPTARIVWGSPALITIDLCLVLELPSPVRLVALGRMRAVLPEERDPVVRLQVDVLGVIDFDRQSAAVDATLIDSRVAQFALTGDLALRMSWGPDPVFLLAVGGFHPRFVPPPGFPALDRVAVALASGDNPKLRLEAYLALTSNTVQFGARVDVGARAGSFSIGGFMSFDALVTLSPLAFVVDIAAKLAVKAGQHTLMSISLALTLSGPRPWHAHGRASFSILFFDVSFGFDLTVGDPAPATLPSPIDVAPLLLAALADPRSWAAQLPAGADVVTLRAIDAGTAVLAHPSATLQVRQRVAPLERTLDRFGTSVPSGGRRFRITLATVGGVRTTLAPLQDRFAPAQFTAMSDDQKLSAASFEAMTSGAALGADGYSTGVPVTVGVSYEQALVTAEGITPPGHQRLALPLDVFATLTATTPPLVPAFAVRDVA